MSVAQPGGPSSSRASSPQGMLAGTGAIRLLSTRSSLEPQHNPPQLALPFQWETRGRTPPIRLFFFKGCLQQPVRHQASLCFPRCLLPGQGLLPLPQHCITYCPSTSDLIGSHREGNEGFSLLQLFCFMVKTQEETRDNLTDKGA